MPTLAHSGSGKVTALWGTALIRGADGKMRLLKVGDTVRQGDVILTTQDGIVQIDTADGTRALATGTREAPVDEIDRVITGLNQGDADVAPRPAWRVAATATSKKACASTASARASTAAAPAAQATGLDRPPAIETTTPTERATAASSEEPEGPPAPPRRRPGWAPTRPRSAQRRKAHRPRSASVRPTGTAPTPRSRSAQVPAIGEMRKADGTLVTAGQRRSRVAELTGLTYVPRPTTTAARRSAASPTP